MWQQELNNVIHQCNFLKTYRTENISRSFIEAVDEMINASNSLLVLVEKFPDTKTEFRQYLIDIGERIDDLNFDLRTHVVNLRYTPRFLAYGIDYLGNQIGLDDQQHEALQYIYDVARQIDNWMQTDLGYKKVSTGLHSRSHFLEMDFFNIKDFLVERLSTLLMPQFKNHILSINLLVPPDMHDVYADTLRTKQILSSILDAIQSIMKNANLTVRVEPDPDKDSDLVVVSVVVGGSGIDSEQLEAMMASPSPPFIPDDKLSLREQVLQSQKHNRTRKPVSKLHVAKQIAELQGSKFWVENKLDEKVTFSFTLHTEVFAID